MKYFLFSILLICSILGSPVRTLAQQADSAKVKITRVPKFKPPTVKTMLGNYSNGDTITLSQANELITLPLHITSEKGGNFTITSYHFLYKRKGSILNQETGRERVVFTTISDLFKVTPLPEGWIKGLKGNFQSDEQWQFFDIVVKGPDNQIFYAPNLKITLE